MSNNNPANQFLFRRSYLEAVEKLPEKEKLATLLAIIEYGLSDCDVWSVTAFEAMSTEAFSSCVPQIIEDSIRVRKDVDAAAEKSENIGKERA